MYATPAHRSLAEKFVFQKNRQDAFVPDSLLDLVTFTYTEEEGYKPPAKSVVEYTMNRYCEIKGVESPILDRVGLGVSRLLEKYSPLHVSGPKYRPR